MLPADDKLAFTDLAGPFMLYIKVALLSAIFVASPFLLFQLWLFLRPGLYKRERRLAVPFIMFTTIFFLAGGLFGYYVAFPDGGRLPDGSRRRTSNRSSPSRPTSA